MALNEDARAPVEAPPVRWGMGEALAGNATILVASVFVVTTVVVLLGEDAVGDGGIGMIVLLQVPVWLGLLGAPLFATYAKGRGSLAADFGLRMRWTDIPLGVIVGIGGQFVLGALITIAYDLLGIDVDRVGESAEALTEAAQGPVGVVLLVLVVVVAAPVLEELFYRGLWLRSAERRLGRPAAVALTSLLFGAIHFQLYDFPALVGVGLLFAVLTVWSGRLGPAIWAHVAFNATTVVSLLALSN
jgi:uncharacterized protein